MQIKMIYNITNIHYLECIPISNSKNHNYFCSNLGVHQQQGCDVQHRE